MRFQIHHDSEGRWQWTMYDENDKAVARSPADGYISEHAVQDATAAVKRGAPNAYVEF